MTHHVIDHVFHCCLDMRIVTIFTGALSQIAKCDLTDCTLDSNSRSVHGIGPRWFSCAPCYTKLELGDPQLKTKFIIPCSHCELQKIKPLAHSNEKRTDPNKNDFTKMTGRFLGDSLAANLS